MTQLQTKPKILLVEDDLSTQSALIRLFRSQFEVVAVDNPEKALQLIKNGLGVDVVFSDYSLPGQSGLVFLSQVQQLLPMAMRIILTGHLNVDELTTAMKNNILHRVFLKPWENNILLFQLQEVLKQQETLLENNKLEKLSVTDSVTGLFNHRYFLDNLQKEIDRALRHHRALSLILIDIDLFKTFNDQMGHPKGDELLKLVADQLKNGVRTIDSVSRYGGDEFAITLPDTPKEGAHEVAERLRQAFIHSQLGQSYQVTISLGVASLSDDINSMDLLVEKADKALYLAKKKGKNQTVQG